MTNRYLEKIASLGTVLKSLKPKKPPLAGTKAAAKFNHRPEKAETVPKAESKDSLWDAHQRKNKDFPGGLV